MKVKPWLKFEPSAWLNDIQLRSCSLAERGLLIDLVCIAHRSSNYGVVLDEYTPEGVKMLAHMLNIKVQSVERMLNKLLLKERLVLNEVGQLYIKRMVQDHEYACKQSVHGIKGGNPTLKGSLKPEKIREEETREDKSVYNFDIAFKHWNSLVKDRAIPTISKFTNKRKKKYATRCDELGGEDAFWSAVEKQLPLLGDFALESTWFKFDWLLHSEDNFAKFAEGSYGDAKKGTHKADIGATRKTFDCDHGGQA